MHDIGVRVTHLRFEFVHRLCLGRLVLVDLGQSHHELLLFRHLAVIFRKHLGDSGVFDVLRAQFVDVD